MKSLNKAERNPHKALSLRANFSWTFIGNTVNAISWFGMTIVLAKLGSPEHVGQFALGLAIAAPVFMFASLRLREVQATDAKQEYLFADYFALRIVTTVLALIVVTGIVLVADFQSEMVLVILATALSKSIESISDALYGMFMQYERLDRVAKSMMMKGPLSLFGLAAGFHFTGSVFWGVIGLATARLLILLSYDFLNASLIMNTGAKPTGLFPGKFPRPRWNATILIRLARLTIPLGFVTMLISYNMNIPRYFIDSHMGAYYLGIFAAIASFQKAGPTVIQALVRSASPRMAKYYSVNNSRAFNRLAFKMLGITSIMGIAGVLVAIVLGRQILTLFYGPEYALPVVFGLVMVAAGINYIATMFLSIITSARYFKIQLPLHLLTTGTIALFSFFLIPPYGLLGAAVALIIGDLVRAGGTMAAAWHAKRSLRNRVIISKPHVSVETL